MIVVVASAHDPRARELAAGWGERRASLLSADDLSRPGWRLEIPATGRGQCVAGGNVIPDAAISGVLTLRPRIYAEELAHVSWEERDYVAAEMTAVLMAWLAALPCPVVNMPAGGALAGPNWPPLRWRCAARALGLTLAEEPPRASATVDVVVVGQSCFGTGESGLVASARALARKAGVGLLGCRFTRDGRFQSATPWPALDRAEVREALAELLEAER